MKTVELLSELRGLTVEDLRQRAVDLDERVFRLRLQSSMGQLEAAGKLKSLRRDVARLKTALREKESV